MSITLTEISLINQISIALALKCGLGTAVR
jgi:hypothetical protein